jgi:hypothetical protein
MYLQKEAMDSFHAHGFLPIKSREQPWSLPTASVHIQELVSGQTPYSTTSTTKLLRHML